MNLRIPISLSSLLFLLAPALSLADSASPLDFAMARSASWSNELQWGRLLHYGGPFGLFQSSEIDGHDTFFLDPVGHRDPNRELLALIRAVLGEPRPTSPKADDHPSCRFPMRTRWLERKLQEEFPGYAIHRQPCPGLDSFRRSVDAVGASIVFSSYYINGPASTFGHTLLRLHKQKAGTQQELLDLGINFSAMVPEGTNPVAYALLGLMGGFQGRFSSVPYYFKIREYTDFESRDLWTYELNLSRSEIDDLVDHIWELGPSYLNYWFFTENCSYLVFSILEAIRPSLELKARLPKHTIPAETIRIAWEEPGLVKAVSFRPSIRKQFESRYEGLTFSEKALLLQVARTEDLSPVTAIPSDESSARLLDALMDYLALKFPREDLQSRSLHSSFKSRVFEQRASISITTPEQVIEPDPLLSPHLAHPTQRLTLAGGTSPQDGRTMDAEFRFAMHTLTDPDLGYPSQAEVEFLAVKATMPVKVTKPRIEEVRLINIGSLNDVTAWDRSSSFRFRVAYDRDDVLLCGGCGIASIRGGRGYSLLLTRQNQGELRAFGFLNAGALMGDFSHGALDATLGASVGLHGRIHRRMAVLSELFFDAFWKNRTVRQSVRASTQLNVHLSSLWSIFGNVEWSRDIGTSSRLGVSRYF